jgi:peptide/nickel transport system permease protein
MRLPGALRYLRRNPTLGVGLLLLAALAAFCLVGALLVPTSMAEPLSVKPNEVPSLAHPFGTDRTGRDLLAVMVAGTPLTLRIGLLAGVLGLGIGTLLAFVSGYYGGVIDTIIRSVVDVGLTIPSLLVMIIIAVSVRESLTVDQMGLIVGSLAWMWPARTIRAQVLTLRERGWVQLARLSGMGGPEIIVREMIPNLAPYLASGLAGAVATAILASIGLEALGLGPMSSPTIGMTIYWAIYYSAILQGMWWWWMPPIVILIVLFMGLFLVATGLDEVANPRLRKAA